MKRKLLYLFPILLSFSVNAEVIVEETWSNGDHTVHDPANNSLAWFTSAAGSTLTSEVGSMTQEGVNRFSVANFTSPGATVAIEDGESITVTFDITLNGTLSGNSFFRFGLWNSGGNRIEQNGLTNNNELFTNYTGYAFFRRANGESASLRKRITDNENSHVLINNFGPYPSLAFTEEVGPLEGNVEYQGEYTLTRFGDELHINFKMNDFEMSAIDEEPLTYEFDSIGFLTGTNMGNGFTLRSVIISKSSEDPDPVYTFEELLDRAFGSWTSIDGQWYESDVLTSFASDEEMWPVIYHADIGWAVVSDSGANGLWLYSPDLDWVWTRADIRDWFYSVEFGWGYSSGGWSPVE